MRNNNKNIPCTERSVENNARKRQRRPIKIGASAPEVSQRFDELVSVQNGCLFVCLRDKRPCTYRGRSVRRLATLCALFIYNRLAIARATIDHWRTLTHWVVIELVKDTNGTCHYISAKRTAEFKTKQKQFLPETFIIPNMIIRGVKFGFLGEN